METILRKVSVNDRLPSSVNGYYFTDYGYLYFTENNSWKDSDGDSVWEVEYWYEEVDLKQTIIDLIKGVESETRNDCAKVIIDLLAIKEKDQTSLAKERYEKALEYRNNNVAEQTPFFYTDYIHIDYVETALKIAAGLE